MEKCVTLHIEKKLNSFSIPHSSINNCYSRTWILMLKISLAYKTNNQFEWYLNWRQFIIIKINCYDFSRDIVITVIDLRTVSLSNSKFSREIVPETKLRTHSKYCTIFVRARSFSVFKYKLLLHLLFIIVSIRIFIYQWRISQRI